MLEVLGDLDDAAGIRRGDRVGAGSDQVGRLAPTEFGGRLGLEQVIDPGRAAAQLPFRGGQQLWPEGLACRPPFVPGAPR